MFFGIRRKDRIFLPENIVFCKVLHRIFPFLSKVFLLFLQKELTQIMLMKNYSCIFALALSLFAGHARAAGPDVQPTPGQQAMIDRKYGMFLHFGMNTYLNAEWSDGSAAASVYAPPADIAEKAAGWVSHAKRAGMRSIVLTTKHHDGFCLWDSKYTDYDVANPQVRHKADIVKAVSDACKKEGIAFSIYYSLWDRHEPLYKDPDPRKYIEFMKNQLGELMSQYGPVAELWFDGAWDRKVEQWYLQEVYDFVKKLQPQCQISTNWTVGKRPVDMKNGDPIVYFPSDFRLWDPFLPVKNDPKIYTYQGKEYYLPYECTQTISVLGNWFAHPEDRTVRELEELEEIFHGATANDNCLLLNIPPDTKGEQNPLAVKRIEQLAALLGIKNGGAFPKTPKKPSSLTRNATATATGVRDNDALHNGAIYAVDSDVSTAWTGDTLSVLNVRLEKPVSFKQVFLTIGKGSIMEYALEYLDGSTWKTIRQDRIDPATQPQSFMGYGFIDLKLDHKIQARDLRLRVLQSNGQPSVYSLRLR